MNASIGFRDLFQALILRPLINDPFRTAITVIGLAIGVAVFLSIRLANTQTMLSFNESVDIVLGKADAVVHAEGLPFDEIHLKKLNALKGVVKAYPIVEGYGMEVNSGEVVEFLGADLRQNRGLGNLSIKTRRKGIGGLMSLLTDPTGIIIPEIFIPGTPFQLGDQLQFLINGREQRLRVNAMVENQGIGKAFKGNYAIMPIAALQRVMQKTGKLDRIEIEFLGDADFDDIQKQIANVLPDFLKIERPERKNQHVEKMLQAFQYNLTALSFVALLVGMYLIYNMISLSVVRRRMEIGALRAIGASPGLIAWIFILEAGIIGLLGSALGIGLGFYFAKLALIAVSMTVNNLYVSSQVTEVVFPWGQMGPYFLLGLGLSFISALIPAWDAANTSPTVVMRRGSYDLKLFHGNRKLNHAALMVTLTALGASQLPALNGFPWFGFLSVFLLILGLSLFSPSILLMARTLLHRPLKRIFGGEGLLAARNLQQNIGRNSLAVSSLAIAFMMVISMSIMVHSFRQTVTIWIEQTLRADLYVKVAGGRDTDFQYTLPEEKVSGLKNNSDIAAVDLFRAVDISYRNQPVVLAAGDFSVLSKFGHLVIQDGPPADELANLMVGKNRAIISEAFSLKHDVEVGDPIQLETPRGELDLTVTAIYTDYSRERGYIVIDRTTFVKYYQDRAINSFVVYLSEGSSLETTRRKILQHLGQDTQFIIRSNQQLKKDVLDVFDKTFAITYSLEIIATVVALLGLFNTLISLILERKREIGILRFLGAYKNQVRRMIFVEAGILGLVGSVMGLVAGFIVSYILIFVINKQSFGWTIQVHHPLLAIIISTLIFWAVALLAGAYPARLATRLNPKEAVRVG